MQLKQNNYSFVNIIDLFDSFIIEFIPSFKRKMIIYSFPCFKIGHFCSYLILHCFRPKDVETVTSFRASVLFISVPHFGSLMAEEGNCLKVSSLTVAQFPILMLIQMLIQGKLEHDTIYVEHRTISFKIHLNYVRIRPIS